MCDERLPLLQTQVLKRFFFFFEWDLKPGNYYIRSKMFNANKREKKTPTTSKIIQLFFVCRHIGFRVYLKWKTKIYYYRYIVYNNNNKNNNIYSIVGFDVTINLCMIYIRDKQRFHVCFRRNHNCRWTVSSIGWYEQFSFSFLENFNYFTINFKLVSIGTKWTALINGYKTHTHTNTPIKTIRRNFRQCNFVIDCSCALNANAKIRNYIIQ